MDIVDSATRSRMMASVRHKDTGPEMIVRRFLHKRGFRYSLHSKKLPGKPDLALKKFKVAIFVNGCFWHRHYFCKKSTIPKSNSERWEAKFQDNVARDEKNIKLLQELGWNVIVIWDCGLDVKRAQPSLDWLLDSICNPKTSYMEWPVI